MKDINFFDKKFFFIFLFFLVIGFSFKQVNSFFELSYCYDKKTGEIERLPECSPDEISVSEGYDEGVCKIDGVRYTKVAELQKLWIDLNSATGSISQFAVNGEEYDIENPNLINCDLLPKNDDDIEATLTLEVIQDWEEGVSTTYGDGGDDSSDDEDPHKYDTDSRSSNANCKDLGGPFGLFFSKNSCELGNSNCIYNVNGINILRGDLDNDFGITYSCQKKSDIVDCFDYKTENNCENDRAGVFKNGGHCTWVPSFEFDTHFLYKNGICIQTNINNESLEKNLDISHKSLRGNLIEDPSFENSNQNIDSSQKAFNLNKYYVLNSDSQYTFSQNITDFYRDLYKLYFYIKTNKSIKLSYTLQTFDFEDSPLETIQDDYTINSPLGVFEKVSFRQISKSLINENSSKAILTISSNDTIAFLDSLTLISYFNEDSSLNFYPFEIYPQEASLCSKCFDEYGFNLCSQDKSNFLGDCSYMVLDNSDKYVLGENFLGDRDLNIYNDKWESQSIVNSNLMCEMYKTENSCVDSNNYINSKFSSYHSTDGNLCTWHSDYGCFKDSYGDKIPDRIGGEIFSDNGFGNYKDEDFKHACDLIPPQAYIYFEGKNKTGDLVIFDDLGESDDYGDIYVNFNVYDPKSPNCENLGFSSDLDNQIYYFLNNDYTNQILYNGETKEPLSDFIEDSDTILSFEFFDSSGNIFNKIFYTDFVVDLSPPNITLVNEQNPIYTKNYTFNFSIKDKSFLDYCSFTIQSSEEVVKNEGFLDSSNGIYLNKIVDFTNEDPRINETYINFSSNINETYPEADTYDLVVTCEDIFGQKKDYVKAFTFDLNPDINIIEPSLDMIYEDSIYIGKNSSFMIYSANSNLDECTLYLGNNGYSLNNTYIEEGFEYLGKTFYRNITNLSALNSLEDGFYESRINCLKPFDITRNFNITKKSYIPKLEIQNTYRDDNTSYYIDSEGIFYSNHRNLPVILNTTVEDYNLSFFLETNKKEIEVFNGTTFTNESTPSLSFRNINNTKAEIRIPEISIYEGVLIESGFYKGLYNYTFNFTYFDKLENSNNIIFSYLKDKENPPKMNISGDFIQDEDENVLYTTSTNPTFKINFTSPLYKTFNCTIEYIDYGDIYNDVYNEYDLIKNRNKDISIEITEIGTDIEIEQKNDDTIFFDCIDNQYNKTIQNLFTIKYDNSSPILEEVNLYESDEKFIRTREGVKYDDIIDKLIFKIEEDKEQKINCYYNVQPKINYQEFYTCENNFTSKEFNYAFNEISYTTDEINFLRDDLDESSLCVRTEKVNELVKSTPKRSFTHEFEILSYCKNSFNYYSNETSLDLVKTDLKLTYYLNDVLNELDFIYENYKAIPRVEALIKLEEDLLLQDLQGNILCDSFTTQDNQIPYIYEDDSCEIDLNVYGGQTLKVSVIDKSESIEKTLQLDDDKPEIDFEVLDISGDIVYSQNVSVILDLFDRTTSIKNFNIKQKVEENYVTIVDNFEKINSNEDYYILQNILSEEISETSKNGFEIILDFYVESQNIEDKLYEFEIEAEDLVGLRSTQSFEFRVKDGIGVILIDSDNTYTSKDKLTVLTKDEDPTIMFRTTKNAKGCSINNEIARSEDDRVFTLNLSEFSDEIINQINNTQEIGIQCSNIEDGVTIFYPNRDETYKRYIRYDDSIPDYVLSSKSFLYNSDDGFLSSSIITKSNQELFCEMKYYDDFLGFEEISNEFRKEINFDIEIPDSLEEDNFNVTIRCMNKIGIYGLNKTYTFRENKIENLNLTNFMFFDNDITYSLFEDTKFYVPKNTDLSFSFLTNNNCIGGFETSLLKKDSSLVSIVLSFFGISDKTEVLVDEINVLNEYIFNLNEVLTADEYVLTISCGEDFTKEFNILTQEKRFNIIVDMIS